jgi:hypothetical protein
VTGGWLRAAVVLALLLDVVLAVALLRRNDQGAPTPGAQVDERIATSTPTGKKTTPRKSSKPTEKSEPTMSSKPTKSSKPTAKTAPAKTSTPTRTSRPTPRRTLTVPFAAPSTPPVDLTGHVVLPRRRYRVPAGTTLRLTGAVTPPPEDASARIVHVEALRSHTWVRFPVPARTDRSGTFDAYVDLGGPGRYRVRLVDGDRSRSPATATVIVE